MKKTLIICITLVLLATAALVTVIVLKSSGEEYDKEGTVKDGKSKSDITYEQFTEPMIDNMSAEMIAEVQRLFEEFQNAQSDEETNAVYEELINLGVYGDKEEWVEKKEWVDEKNVDKDSGGGKK